MAMMTSTNNRLIFWSSVFDPHTYDGQSAHLNPASYWYAQKRMEIFDPFDLLTDTSVSTSRICMPNVTRNKPLTSNMSRMTRHIATLFLIQLVGLALSFSNQCLTPRRYDTSICLFGGGGVSKLPKSSNDRDKLAIDSIKEAISKPRNPSFPLVECEFPPLEALNKLGDGSQRSADQVDDANFAFAAKLVKSLSWLPFGSPNVYLLLSAASSARVIRKAQSFIKGATYVGSLKDGVPDTLKKGDVVVVVSPCISQDYQIVSQLAKNGVAKGVVIINALAKNPKSVSGVATMAYYLKPLTYNSQLVGYLCRNYPNDWATIDLVSKQVLKSYKDDEILFGNTNTPDLRDPGVVVQKCVDGRAIQSRKN